MTFYRKERKNVYGLGFSVWHNNTGEDTVVFEVDEMTVILMWTMGLKRSEQAIKLGVSESTIDRILQRARPKLSQTIMEEKSFRINVKGEDDHA